MHWNFEQILWALVLAAHLVLLIVLLGRDRSSRFPWFTAAIGFSTVHLIADHLLHGKLTTLAFYWQTYTAILVETILGLLVLSEVCRRILSSGKSGRILNAKGWLGWILVTGSIAIGAGWAWGPWPAWKALLRIARCIAHARKRNAFNPTWCFFRAASFPRAPPSPDFCKISE